MSNPVRNCSVTFDKGKYSSYNFPQFTSTSIWYDVQKQLRINKQKYCKNNFHLRALGCTCAKIKLSHQKRNRKTL